ncbi:VAS1 [[Candida] subhashii]|uniref:Valine--tRNA ligase, mitochondrial n=1 Tax=[Candida] subhashii TaxID=561895 RepID=A0A8J5QG39_9ASCO|nr:VAS1 [[Candida] subhashii]KAG7661468.1 VAS1 [[Candida] subhashii]
MSDPISPAAASATNPDAAPSAATRAGADANAEAPRPKTAKELEKERKKAEKLAKFEAKKAKQEAAKADAAKKSQDKPKKVKKVVEPIPEFVDKTKAGDKKILISLDDPSLKAYNPSNVESSWYSWWEKQGFFEPELTEDGKAKKEGVFTIPCPPPNVTGALHIGHALTVSIQDTLIRWNRMQGKTTLFIPGFDHAGIATQSVVEKQVWNKEKKTRHDYGREKFVEKVWEWKEEYHHRIKNQFKKLGASYDWSREKFTLNPDLSEAVTEAFVRLHEDGTIYRANRLVNWSVKLNTAISNLEVDNKLIAPRSLLSIPGYDNKIEFGVLTSFSYPVEGSDEKITVATTRPETIFGDTGVAVHPDDERYKHLHGKFVQHPFLDRKLPIICDSEAVDMEFGTGAVKITPAHDQNDYNTGKRNNLEFINIYTDDGFLNENCGPEWKGMKRFDARSKVIEALKEKGLYVGQEANEMNLPICSRSGDVIEPLLKPQWYVNQQEMAKDAIAAVERGEINIAPQASRAEYFRWLENIQDWCISRQLWWGHRCPVYFVVIEGEEHDRIDNEYWISGRTKEEALEKATAKFPNKKFTLEQDEDVLDTWFSSGLWAISTLGWPNNTKDLELFAPQSLLETGWDILFFWVARMILMTLKLTGKVPFNEVFCHALVRDAQGRKMSKSLGNVIDPIDVMTGISLDGLRDKLLTGNLAPAEVERATQIQKQSFPKGIPECGTDALRFALCAYSTGGRDINLDILRVEGYRKFCNKIYQATKFVLGRLGEDYVPPKSSAKTGQESLPERWILNKLTIASGDVNKYLEARDFSDAANTVYTFWYDLCDVYIENSKYLMQDGTPEQKLSAQNTLYTCIETLLRLTHPFMPFITEEMWQRLPKREGETAITVMKAKYPEYEEGFADEEGSNQYNLVLDIVKTARSELANFNILKGAEIYLECKDEASYKTTLEQQDSIVSMVKPLDSLKLFKQGENGENWHPAGSVVTAVGLNVNLYVIIKGHADIPAEISKYSKKLHEATVAEKKLQKVKASFNDSTDEAVITSTNEKYERTMTEIETFTRRLQQLELNAEPESK